MPDPYPGDVPTEDFRPSEGDQADQADSSGGLASESLAIAVGTAISRITGAGRIVVGAAVLGPTVIGDLFLAVNLLPLMLVGIFGGPAVTSILVPPLVRRLNHDPAEADRLVSAVMGLVISALGAISAVVVFARGWIARVFIGGVPAAERDRAIEIASDLLAFMVPQLVVYGMVAVLVATQHARQRFLLPSFAPAIENVVLIATLFAIAPTLGDGPASDRTVNLLVLASWIALLAHLAIQWWGTRRAGARFGATPPWGGRLDGLDEMASPTRYSMIWTAASGALQFATIVVSGYAALGGIQAMEIAMLVAILPAAIVGYPIAAAILPRLARDNPKVTDIARAATDGWLLALWILIPFGVAMFAFARPIAEALAFGRFEDDSAIDLTAMAMRGLSVAAIVTSLFEIGRQATMAWGELAGLARSIWISVIVAIVGFGVALAAFEGPTMLLVVGLALSLATAVAVIVLMMPIFARNPPDSDRVRTQMLDVGLVTGLALAVGLGIEQLVSRITANPQIVIALVGAAFLLVLAVASRGGRGARSLVEDLDRIGT